MRDAIRPVDDLDEELVEGWERVTDEPDILGVGSSRSYETEWSWQVEIGVAEFIREEPLEGELRRAVRAALGVVPGVRGVEEQDREVWIVDGDPSGEALVRAVADVVDAFADRTRTAYNAH